MTSRDETTKYGAALPEDDFLLEEILAEYGGGREQKQAEGKFYFVTINFW